MPRTRKVEKIHVLFHVWSRSHVRLGVDRLFTQFLPFTGRPSISSIFKGQNITFKPISLIVNVPAWFSWRGVSGKCNRDKTNISLISWISWSVTLFQVPAKNHRRSSTETDNPRKEVSPTKSVKIVHIPWTKCQHFQIRRPHVRLHPTIWPAHSLHTGNCSGN